MCQRSSAFSNFGALRLTFFFMQQAADTKNENKENKEEKPVDPVVAAMTGKSYYGVAFAPVNCPGSATCVQPSSQLLVTFC